MKDEDWLNCIFCSGKLKVLTAIKNTDLQYLQCVECDKIQIIFKTDYLAYLGDRLRCNNRI